MEEKQFKEVLEKNNNQISKIFEKKLNLGFDLVMEKVDNRLTKHSKELKEDYNRQGKFLLDEFKHQTSIVAEQYTDLRNGQKNLGKKVDAILEMTAHNTENIEFIKSSLKRKIDLEEFESLEKRVMLLERKLQAV